MLQPFQVVLMSLLGQHVPLSRHHLEPQQELLHGCICPLALPVAGNLPHVFELEQLCRLYGHWGAKVECVWHNFDPVHLLALSFLHFCFKSEITAQVIEVGCNSRSLGSNFIHFLQLLNACNRTL